MSKTLLKSTSSVSGMTLISRILGFLRDMLAAHFFGATAEADAFYVAFKIPNFMRNLFAEGAFQQAFIPVLSEYHAKKTFPEINLFISRTLGCMSAFLIPFCAIGVVIAPLVINIFAPGFDAEPHRFVAAVQMLRVMFPYLFFLFLSAFMGSVLNTYGKFLAPAFAPSILNICMIGTAIFLSPHLIIPVESQSYAVPLAGILQIVFLAPFMYRLGLLHFPRINWRDAGVKRVFKLMMPALFGASVGQISMLVTTIFASFLPIGSVTWLYFSERLMQFPLGVIGVALATVVLPHLSRQHAAHSAEEFRKALDWGIRINFLVGTLATTTLWLMSGPLIATLFKYGKFNSVDVMMAQRSTIAYAIGMQAFMLGKIVASGFYAKQNIKTPVKVGLFVVALNILLDALLIFPLAHAGLALASSIAQWTNICILIFLLHKKGFYKFDKSWITFLIQLFVANIITGLLFWYAAFPLDKWLEWHATERFLKLIGWLLLGTLVYMITLVAAGVRKKDLTYQ